MRIGGGALAPAARSVVYTVVQYAPVSPNRGDRTVTSPLVLWISATLAAIQALIPAAYRWYLLCDHCACGCARSARPVVKPTPANRSRYFVMSAQFACADQHRAGAAFACLEAHGALTASTFDCSVILKAPGEWPPRCHYNLCRWHAVVHVLFPPPFPALRRNSRPQLPKHVRRAAGRRN